MPSSATPSPLDQLAGIEQTTFLGAVQWARDAAQAAAANARRDRQSSNGGPWDDYETVFAALNAHAATLATLREGLAGFGFDQMRELLTRVRNGEQPSAVLLSLLTPDSPRQAGEE